MKRMVQGVVFGVTLVLAGAAAAEKPAAASKQAAPAKAEKAKGGVEAKATFEHLKTLAGEWEGSVGEGKEAVTGTVRYRIASGGTVVEETLMPGGPHEMISLYHLDGDELLLTHYCSSGNQPRLRLDRAASEPGALRFTFVSGTNMDPAKDHHIHGLTLSTTAEGLHHDWMSWMGGKEQHHLRFALHRKGATAAVTPAAEVKPAAASTGHAHH
jgi:hypothetical protein